MKHEFAHTKYNIIETIFLFQHACAVRLTVFGLSVYYHVSASMHKNRVIFKKVIITKVIFVKLAHLFIRFWHENKAKELIFSKYAS